MIAVPCLRRLALLLALLPQILVLALGQGIVVCVAPGGHVQVEIAASACCAEVGSAVRGGDPGILQDEPDCGSCSDLRIALDPRVARSSDARTLELPSAPAALPVEPPAFPKAAERTRPREHHVDRGHEPPHLIHLRSVLLRC